MESCNAAEEYWEYRVLKDEEGTYSIISVQIKDGKIIEAIDDCVPFGDTLVELEVDLQEMLHGAQKRLVLIPKDLEHLDIDHNVFRMNNVGDSCGS